MTGQPHHGGNYRASYAVGQPTPAPFNGLNLGTTKRVIDCAGNV